MICRIALSCALLVSVALSADTKPPTPSTELLHQMFDQGNYTELLKQLRLILAQKDQSTVDWFDLLKLKGEALLRTKSDTEAADAFRDAAKAAKDEKQAAVCRATEALLRQSHSEMYTPKSRGKSSATTQPAISVVDSTSRKEAFSAMYDDELAAKTQTINAAKKATSLPPIMSVAPTLQQLEDLDQAAHDSTDKS